MKAKIRVGISGWRYGGWRGVFYPEGLRQKDELHYASRHVGTIEINGTFYSLQRAESFELWKSETPDDFVFSVKGSRYITHMLRLKDSEQALANFFAQGVLGLGEKMGPILWQLPPSMKFTAERVESFLASLPRSGEEATKLARRHDKRLKGRARLAAEGVGTIRHAMEIRHKSFCCEEFLEILRRYNVASVVSDSAQRFPVINDVTSDLVYVRLHGNESLYSGPYSDKLLKEWASRARAWQKGWQQVVGSTSGGGGDLVDENYRLPKTARDVFIYFDNDAKVDAPRDAARLEELLRS